MPGKPTCAPNRSWPRSRNCRGWRGFIRVATSEGFALDLLPNAIADFHAHCPGIRFELQMLPPAEVTQAVAAGDADIGITFLLAPTSLVRVVYDNVVEMIALSAPDDPLAKKASIGIADLRAYPIAVPRPDTTARQVFDAACLAEGIVIEPTLMANILSALLPVVRRTRGLALMSALSVQTPIRLGDLVGIPARSRANLMRGIQVQVMRERRLPHAVQAFLRQLVAALPPVEPGGVRRLNRCETCREPMRRRDARRDFLKIRVRDWADFARLHSATPIALAEVYQTRTVFLRYAAPASPWA